MRAEHGGKGLVPFGIPSEELYSNTQGAALLPRPPETLNPLTPRQPIPTRRRPELACFTARARKVRTSRAPLFAYLRLHDYK